ncbi:hypothetical protein FRD01_11740 [Microvenator marinus]|uniref:Uncharacterized protein n=1 Tax=Microvenator marinus TaxID=2600177 RepID=A0A5B8XQT3_9DELT|nr:hypothetical protein [Microvenator marinus]QED27895.1 hypothetical protein FRD01_11740 [Microvenator marinus]
MEGSDVLNLISLAVSLLGLFASLYAAKQAGSAANAAEQTRIRVVLNREMAPQLKQLIADLVEFSVNFYDGGKPKPEPLLYSITDLIGWAKANQEVELKEKLDKAKEMMNRKKYNEAVECLQEAYHDADSRR